MLSLLWIENVLGRPQASGSMYYHPSFRRHDRNGCSQIVRASNANTSSSSIKLYDTNSSSSTADTNVRVCNSHKVRVVVSFGERFSVNILLFCLSHALLGIVSANAVFHLTHLQNKSESSPHLRWHRILLRTHGVCWTYHGTDTLTTINANSIRGCQVSKNKLTASVATPLTPKVNRTHTLPPC